MKVFGLRLSDFSFFTGFVLNLIVAVIFAPPTLVIMGGQLLFSGLVAGIVVLWRRTRRWPARVGYVYRFQDREFQVVRLDGDYVFYDDGTYSKQHHLRNERPVRVA